MALVLGLDLGTNSIGWSVIDNVNNTIIKSGSRIIPMDAATLGDFEKGNIQSAAKERTAFRGTRRLYERAVLRRERLLRVLNVLGFLPQSFRDQIDFVNHPGKFKNHSEPLLPYAKDENGRGHFLFMNSFNEMIEDFKRTQPNLVRDGKLVPYDWTIFYLRKKSLTQPISKEELAWIILNFNTKRGYYQLRGMDDDMPSTEENKQKREEYRELSIQKVEEEDADKKKVGFKWYKITYEDGITQKVSRKNSPAVGTKVECIVTTTLDKDGKCKVDKEGDPMIKVRTPNEDDWGLVKKRTEHRLKDSGVTVGAFIYEHLLSNPDVKVRGKLIHTIERDFYKSELKKILDKQCEYIPELRDGALYQACIKELYKNNDSHRNQISRTDFTNLFVNDIIFYQRPLKSKKSLIANCPLETYTYKQGDTWHKEPIKCIPKSHPIYEEFRLWQFIERLRIYQRSATVNGKKVVDYDVTDTYLSSGEDYANLFDSLCNKKEIKQKQLLKAVGITKSEDYRWNYVDDDAKAYPCCPTRYGIYLHLSKVNGENHLNDEGVVNLWHILYSVDDPIECGKALRRFALRYGFPVDDFVKAFKQYVPESKDYGAYSEKAIKRLLPLMRFGKYWREDNIDSRTLKRINSIVDGEVDESISTRTREKLSGYDRVTKYQGMPLWLASYAVYGRHSESAVLERWESPEDIDQYLHDKLTHNSLRNPIVEKVVCETLRVVRDIWKTYGKIGEVHVEMGRNLKQDAKSRARTTNTILENERTNLRIRALLQEFANPSYGIENVHPFSPSQQEILRIYEDGVINNPQIEKDEEIEKIIKDLSSSKTVHVSRDSIMKYKMWLEQKYMSPYTGRIIPLSKLFTPAYEIEHVIPQSRYFDDSFSNKVICESEVNKDKGNMLAYEYICKKGRSIVKGRFGENIHIFDKTQYEDFVERHYSRNRSKMKKLLLEDIPEGFISRQLNDSRYMSKLILSMLSCLVRDENEAEAVSRHVISTNGAITDRLKKDWGLNDVWNRIIAPRFERLNSIDGDNNYGEWVNREGKRFFQINVPLALSVGFSKKRLDHRHHALDAIVIACTTRNIVNYLNNSNAASSNEDVRHDLKISVCYKDKTDNDGNYTWRIKKPWETITQDVAEQLDDIIVSFKQNLRIITRTSNYYTHYVGGKKVVDRQVKGDRWAIRKSMHKATVSGLVRLQCKKVVRLKEALGTPENIVDKALKADIRRVAALYHGKASVDKLYRYYKDRDFKTLDGKGKDVKNVEVYYCTGTGNDAMSASRVDVDTSFDRKTIDKVTDSCIRKIMLAHLDTYSDGGKDHPELAFSPEGIEEMNRNIRMLNGGKDHKPIYKVRKSETMGMKFPVGETGNKSSKYVEADKGTNLFFAIYVDTEGNRSFESIPLNIAIERKKQGLPIAEERKEDGKQLLFMLSPNDLVMITHDDKQKRIYKMVSCNKRQCFFVPQSWATMICDGKELGAANKMEIIEGTNIKQKCEKIIVDRLGRIIKVYKADVYD